MAVKNLPGNNMNVIPEILSGAGTRFLQPKVLTFLIFLIPFLIRD